MSPEQPSSPSNPITNDEVIIDPECEIRFAVVMYGGVSLAIYINGVAQELLNLVRATAPNIREGTDPLLPDEKLTGAAKVYRKLGQCLAIPDLDERLSKLTQSGALSDAITTRFIVDVISGTSAGGINGVFLAKALTQTQTLDGLKQLWLSEGDLGKLLNDKTSLKNLPRLPLKSPPESLLNSQRMYGKLLEALAQMDPSRGISSVYLQDAAESLSTLVDELDLFTTTTDIEGLPLPISLSDRLVFERRYKNIFHFRYVKANNLTDERNDFVAQNDPFLAFAARCTSSFPFAFEPTCLNQIVEVTQAYPRYTGAKNEISRWNDFFSDYLRTGLFDLDRDSRGEQVTGKLPDGETVAKAQADLQASFMSRSFGDGGYLDNKPFTYATTTLGKRFADCDVQRKLLYVEPSPEHPELLCTNTTPPDFAENVRAAVLDLPRQETIREDIERLQERNAVINRLITFGREVDNDLSAEQLEPLRIRKFLKAYVEDVVKVKGYGIGYGPYHRLIVGEITSFLAEIVARAKGHDPASNAGLAIRELVAAWRRAKYSPQREPGKKTENIFLFYNDLHYRFRRTAFLIRRANAFLRLDPSSDGDEDKRVKHVLRKSFEHARKQKKPELKLNRKIAKHIDAWLSDDAAVAKHAATKVNVQVWWEAFKAELRRIKKEVLIRELTRLRKTEHALLGQRSKRSQEREYEDELDAFRESIAKIEVPWPNLRDILNLTDGERRKKADEICQQEKGDFDVAAQRFQKILKLRRPKISRAIQKAPEKLNLNPPSSGSSKQAALEGLRAARLCLLYYNKNFIFYDMVMYPVEYGTSAGEATLVDIFRVSPEDAPSLMDEKPGDIDTSKLAGRTLMSFGAFLDESWRRNDMLWGRLDGAERLICTLLPLPEPILQQPIETAPQKAAREILENRHERRTELIRQAHRGILFEEIKQDNTQAVCALLRHAASQKQKTLLVERLIQDLLDENKDKEVVTRLTEERRAELGTPRALNRQLNAESALNYIARSTNITGNMLSGLAAKNHFEGGRRFGVWIARLGTILWNLVSVAVPQSLRNLFFRHWLGLGYLVSALLILGGVFFSSPALISFGWKAFAISVTLHFITFSLGHYMSGGKFARSVFLFAAAFLVVGLAWCGVLYLTKLIPTLPDYKLRQLTLASAAFGSLAITVGIAELWNRVRSFVRRRWVKRSIRLAQKRREESAQSPKRP